jgi:hypothetical protein
MLAFVLTPLTASAAWPDNIFTNTDQGMISDIKAHADVVHEAEAYLVENCDSAEESCFSSRLPNQRSGVCLELCRSVLR